MHLLAGSWWNLWARKQKKLLEGGCVFAIFSLVKHTFYEFSILPPYMKKFQDMSQHSGRWVSLTYNCFKTQNASFSAKQFLIFKFFSQTLKSYHVALLLNDKNDNPSFTKTAIQWYNNLNFIV